MIIDPARVKAYRRASPLQRLLLQLCALSYEEINRELLFQVVSSLISEGRITENYARPEVEAALEAMLARKLIYREKSQAVRAAQDLVDLAVQDTVRDATLDGFARRIQGFFPHRPGRGSFGSYTVIRDLRIAFYRGQLNTFNGLLRDEWARITEMPDLSLLQPFDAGVFRLLTEPFQRWHLQNGIHIAIQDGEGSPELLAMTEELASPDVSDQTGLLSAWVDLSVARGDLSALRRIDELSGDEFKVAAACEAFLRGDDAAAQRNFAAAIRGVQHTRGGSKHIAVRYFMGLFQTLSLLRQNTPLARSQARKLINAALKQWSRDWAAVMTVVGQGVALQDSPTQVLIGTPQADSLLGQLVTGYVWRWFDHEGEVPFSVETLELAVTEYQSLGLTWLASEVFGLVQQVGSGKRRERKPIGPAVDPGTRTLVDWIRPVHAWERRLVALGQLAATDSSKTSGTTTERMIWELDFDVARGRLSVAPFVQKRTRRGWTKGRAVTPSRLYSGFQSEQFSYLDDRDRDICRSIVDEGVSRFGGFRSVGYSFDLARLAHALVGHPRVFAPGDRFSPLEITSREPHLVITRTDDGAVRLVIDPRPAGSPVVLLEDGPHRLVIVVFGDKHQRLDAIIGESLVVPESESERVLATAQSISAMVAVHSEIGADAANVEMVELDPRPHLHLVPFHTGLRAELFVRPFAATGPFFRPGQGGENVFADIDGAPRAGRRNLDQERTAADDVVAGCPSLAAQVQDSKSEFYFATPEEALELLIELQPLVADDSVVLYWPQGRKLDVAGEAHASQLQLRIRKDRDWFAASGELVVDDSLSLSMMKLIELSEASPSRFIQLEDGRFLALTEQLRRSVADLATGGQRLKDKIRFQAIHAAALGDLGDSVSLKVDKHWAQCIARMRDARDLTPVVPSTLQTELRDYQDLGFAWLARLAHWGVGGCLADDMGLGKTIQALALLLDRAADGPALVVCPTSVGFNWQSEARRFAPTLTAHLFGPGDRKAFVKQLGPRDVVICSYSLLHHESELLQEVAWHTVILDEAQAIKNMATKRSRAVMSLSAEFRLIMTGTPVENHLGELWNLFNFINPGLLGSHESFQSQFASAIERDDSADAKRRLQQLIRPFILRRTKTQVLDELPARTEITVQVDLSKEEKALYEGLRQRALNKLVESADDDQPQHLQILAEIMRLRRACCHPRLVLPETKIASSKLAVFSETIDDLLANRHKALVFSQFVGHLEVLREELVRKGVSYQYLDGSTPAAQRRQRVEAFQAGVGDVFLISLKAGGQGLNLTAADYVIHMDPWWNPAVEDQASDRAHRIGQKRPVTIYRLVAKGTIEERIVELHRTKRDLADTLLEGADRAAKLSGEELLSLLRDT